MKYKKKSKDIIGKLFWNILKPQHTVFLASEIIFSILFFKFSVMYLYFVGADRFSYSNNYYLNTKKLLHNPILFIKIIL